MAKGKKTPRDVTAAFRALYLQTNNSAECARRLKLPFTTAAKLAREADADPEFAEACRSLLARACRVADCAALEGLEIVLNALRRPPLEDSMGTPIDRRAELQRAIVATRDSLDRTAARREDREEKRREQQTGTDRPTRIEIVRFTRAPEQTPPSDEPPCKSE